MFVDTKEVYDFLRRRPKGKQAVEFGKILVET